MCLSLKKVDLQTRVNFSGKDTLCCGGAKVLCFISLEKTILSNNRGIHHNEAKCQDR